MSSSNPLILTIDFGTQSVRACLFDRLGNCLSFKKKTYDPAYFSEKPGYAEMHPDYYFQSLCECTNALVKENEDKVGDVLGIVMSCFRDSAVMLDEDNKVVRPTVLWLDQRMAKCRKKLPFIHRLAFRVVGMSEVVTMNRQRTVLNWIKENEPVNYACIKKYIPLSAYFNYLLTGSMVDTPSDATGHYPLDYKKRTWYKNPEKHMKGQIFGAKAEQLCELVAPGSIIGTITEEANKQTGLPVGMTLFAGGSDKSCETLGAGVIDDSQIAISLGTACSIETTTKRYIEPMRFMPCYSSVLPNLYNMDVQVYRGFWMMNWFLKEFAAEKIDDLMGEQHSTAEYDAKLLSLPSGSDGVILQPYWGPLLDRPQVRGSIVGFSDNTTKYHIYKAIIEGICYELRFSKEHFEKKLRRKFTAIRVSGGGANSEPVCQIIADVFRLPVIQVQTVETSSLGAAIVGFLDAGVYATPEEAARKMARKTKKFFPRNQEADVYDRLYRDVYKKLYPSLKGIYKYLYRFTAR